jgi:hypothetical protein
MAIRYFLPVLVCCVKINLATLAEMLLANTDVKSGAFYEEVLSIFWRCSAKVNYKTPEYFA